MASCVISNASVSLGDPQVAEASSIVLRHVSGMSDASNK